MRVLIVGAGIAGLTLGGLLRQRGQRPDIVERAEDFEKTGYMLGLYPMGSRVLHGLGLHEKYLQSSQPSLTYSLWNSKGRHVRDDRFDVFTHRYGPIQTASRGELLSVLREGLGDISIRMGITVETLEQRGEQVEVTFSDGSNDAYDLVVGADGMGSKVRDLLFGSIPFYRTGWGGWVVWVEQGLIAPDTIAECWGPGCMIGMYPTRDRIGCFTGGPHNLVKDLGSEELSAYLQDRIKHPEGPLKAFIETLRTTDKTFYWELSDVRSPRWTKGRVALVGDAAVGFLPTAGVGASMAMESAAALNDELSRVSAPFVENALRLYVKRRKRRTQRHVSRRTTSSSRE